MEENIKIYNQDEIFARLNDSIKELRNNNSSVFFIEGDIGTGKSAIMVAIRQFIYGYERDIRVALSEAVPPVGNLKIGSMQPLQPFIKALERLKSSESINAKSKLVRNIGLTVLASLPIVDSFAYAYKEINRDIKEFQQDQLSHKYNKRQTVNSFYLEKIKEEINNQKCVILLDDMHWADAQSVELIQNLLDNTESLPLLLILSYNRSIVENQALPFLSILQDADFESYNHYKLKPLTQTHISDFAKLFFPNYRSNREFENWIYFNSNGNPSSIKEYLNYFKRIGAIDKDGELAINLDDSSFIPTTMSTMFTQYIELLSDEEKNMLTICAAEGIEFTALISSKLLNKDVLNVIKDLRLIQSKTNIIKSFGAQNRYGSKTTCYRFTQMYYHNYFKNLLEYEEKIELHLRISDFLKEQYNSTEDTLVKNEIAPYLAAHSLESGDTRTAEDMFYISALNAKELGSQSMLDTLSETIDAISPQSVNVRNSIDLLKDNWTQDSQVVNGGSISNLSGVEANYDYFDFRKSVVNDILNENLEMALDKMHRYIEINEDELNISEIVEINSLISKVYVDKNEFENALNILNSTKIKIKNISDKNAIATLNNSFALYYYAMDDENSVIKYVEKNISLLPFLKIETKLLISSSLALISNKISKINSRKFKEVAINISKELNFEKLSKDLEEI